MKKILKFLAAGFAICFGLFAFTACGNQAETGQFSQANVSTSGKYRLYNSIDNESDTFVPVETVESLENNTSSYKMTIRFSTSGVSFNSTIITVIDDTSGQPSAMAGKMKVSYGGYSIKVEFYAPNDGYVYTAYKANLPFVGNVNEKTKTLIPQQENNVEEGEENEINNALNYLPDGMGSMANFLDADIITNFLSAYQLDGVTLKQATVGTQTKFHLTINGGVVEAFGNNKTNIWVVLNEDGSFAGAKIKGKINGEDLGFSSKITYSIGIVPFEGEIEYPEDLDQYETAQVEPEENEWF